MQLYESSNLPLSTVHMPTAATQPSAPQQEPLINPEKIDFGDFPPSIKDLVNNRLHLNRLLGLSNLFYIDPDDDEVALELLQLRTSLANIIFNCPESDLEAYWSTDLGDRYWSLVLQTNPRIYPKKIIF